MTRTRPRTGVAVAWAAAALLFAALLSACAEPPCPPADLSPPALPPTYAVVSSDYSSTAIALLDRDGSLLDEAFVDSGSAPPGIVAALSGDVVLPSAPFDPCLLVTLDRFGADVVSFFDVCAGGAVGQIDVGSGFAANPHDVLRIDDRTAWITRYTANSSAPSEGLERGNDVLVVDWAAGRLLSRIDLSAADTDTTFARPDRMAILQSGANTRVVVGLARLGSDFMETGSGAVAVVDPETREVTLHPLEGLASCGEVDALADRVVVTCGGVAFADEETRRASAGIVALGLDESGSVVELASWRASDHPSSPVPSGPTVPLGATRWVSVAWGDLLLDLPDRVVVVEPGREPELFLETSPFSVGDGTFDPVEDLLLLPDASRAAVRRFRASEGTELESVDTAGCRGLPPREVRRVRY